VRELARGGNKVDRTETRVSLGFAWASPATLVQFVILF